MDTAVTPPSTRNTQQQQQQQQQPKTTTTTQQHPPDLFGHSRTKKQTCGHRPGSFKINHNLIVANWSRKYAIFLESRNHHFKHQFEVISFHKPYKALQGSGAINIPTRPPQFGLRLRISFFDGRFGFAATRNAAWGLRPIWIDFGSFSQEWCTKLSGRNFLAKPTLTPSMSVSAGVLILTMLHPGGLTYTLLMFYCRLKLDEAGTRSNTNAGPIRSQKWLGTWVFNSVGRSIVIPTTLTCCTVVLEQPPKPKYLRTQRWKSTTKDLTSRTIPLRSSWASWKNNLILWSYATKTSSFVNRLQLFDTIVVFALRLA